MKLTTIIILICLFKKEKKKNIQKINREKRLFNVFPHDFFIHELTFPCAFIPHWYIGIVRKRHGIRSKKHEKPYLLYYKSKHEHIKYSIVYGLLFYTHTYPLQLQEHLSFSSRNFVFAVAQFAVSLKSIPKKKSRKQQYNRERERRKMNSQIYTFVLQSSRYAGSPCDRIAAV